MKRLNSAFRIAVVTALCLASSAQAINIVTNGGFETGDFSGWSQFGNTAFTGVVTHPHSGVFAATFGPVGSLGGISQNISTTPGSLYAVDFWVANEGGTPSEFLFNWDGGAAETDLINSAAFDYTHFSYTLTASSSSTLISFSFRQDPSFMYLDDLNVNATAIDPNPIPEPASFGLFGLGLAGLSLVSRKKLRF